MSELKPRGIQETVDDLVITCIDHRFQRAIGRLLKQDHGIDIEASDRLAYPGASKAVADGTLISAIQTSYRLHDIKSIWLVDHTDCGGFGGLEAYGGDEHQETDAHLDSIARAQQAIHKVLPQLVVTGLVVTLEGQALKSPPA